MSRGADQMSKIPQGPTQFAWYREGYQQALRDLADALDSGGEDKAREWIANNTLRDRQEA